jgi:hypothetical protein
MKNTISIHFDGPIAREHTVQLRTFSKTLVNLQTAIDRAYLDLKYKAIWKNARLSAEDYGPTDFLLKQTREGGFIADLIGGNDDSGDIVKRIHSAVLPAYEQAQRPVQSDSEKLVDEAERRRKHYKSGAQGASDYEQVLESPNSKNARAFGDRSIVKEFDQIASAIRARNNDGSLVEIDLYAEKALPKLTFDSKIATAFHTVVSNRTLGDLVQLPVTLRALDSRNGAVSKAKLMNLITQKEFNLFIHTDRGFSSLRKFLRKNNPPPFVIVAAPVLEYGAFDPMAGDMYFIAIVDAE